MKRLSVLLTLAVAAGNGCEEKEKNFFDPPVAPPGVIMGVVMLDGEPVSGVTLTLDGTTTATTGGDGMYVFDPVAAGSHTVTVSPPANSDCDPSSQVVTVPAGGKATTNFDCVSRPGNVMGAVTLDGEPISGVTLTLDGTTTATTGGDGMYVFDPVAAGSHTVTVSPPANSDCDPSSQVVTVPAGGKATTNFDCVSRPGNVMGAVTLDGEPISGVTLTLDGTTTATTGGDGMYVFDPVAAGSHTVTVSPPANSDCDPSSQVVTVPAGGKATANFDCRTPELEVVKEDGSLMGGVFDASVEIFSQDDPIWFRVIVRNPSIATATNITVTDNLEANLSNLSPIPAGSWTQGVVANQTPAGFVWNIGTLEPGEFATIQFETFANGPQDELGNTVTVTFDESNGAFVVQEFTIVQ